MTQALLIEDLGTVRVLTLNRPERLNALNDELLRALRDAMHECADPDRDIRVVVLRGNGRAFCPGADLKWLSTGVLHDHAAHLRFQDLLQEVCECFESADQVVIASVHGFALAGGLEVTLSCDIAVVAEDAELGDEHIRRNLLPGGGGSQRLPRRLGLPRGLFYLLTGRRIRGAEAERIGLAALSVPAAQLTEATLALAREIARADRRALAAMKMMARRGMEMSLKDGLWLERWTQHRYRSESPSMNQGVADFAARGKNAATDKPA